MKRLRETKQLLFDWLFNILGSVKITVSKKLKKAEV